MELLKRAIENHGKVLPGNVIKVGSFLNNQLDISLLYKMGEDLKEHFKTKKIDKILTIEASGIALATLTAERIGCNVVVAKKTRTANVDGDVFAAECFSYTHKNMNTLIVDKEYIKWGEKVLIVDDFLAHGEAVKACMSILKQAGADLVGVAIAIEKGFQGAGDDLRAHGIDVYSLAIVDDMSQGKISFR